MRRLLLVVPFVVLVVGCGAEDPSTSVTVGPTTIAADAVPGVPVSDPAPMEPEPAETTPVPIGSAAKGFGVLVEVFQTYDNPAFDGCPLVDREVLLSQAGNLPLFSSLGFQSGAEMTSGGEFYKGPPDQAPIVVCYIQTDVGPDGYMELAIGIGTTDVDAAEDFVGWWRSLVGSEDGIVVTAAGSGDPVAGCLQEEFLDYPTCVAGSSIADLDIYVTSNAVASDADLRDLLTRLLPDIEAHLIALSSSSVEDFALTES